MKIYFNFLLSDSRRFYLISCEVKSASKVGNFFSFTLLCDKVEEAPKKRCRCREKRLKVKVSRKRTMSEVLCDGEVKMGRL